MKKFEIRGNVKGSISLNYIRLAFAYKSPNGIYISSDSIPINKGEFKIKGKIAYPHAMHIFYEDSVLYLSSKIFFIEAGVQFLNFNTDSIDNITPNLKGSKIHNAYIQNFFSKDIIQKEIELNKYLDTVTINEESTRLFKSMRNSFYEERDDRLMEASRNFCCSIIPAWLVLDYIHRKGFSPHYFDIYNTLGNKNKNTDLGRYLYNKINNASATRIGGEFPALELRDSGLIVFKAKIANTSKAFTLIDFWFGKCSPCIKQFPAFKEMYEKYGKEYLEIITISIDREKDIPVWRDVIKKYQLPWIQYLDIGGVEAQKLSINSYPTNFLIDRTGKIFAKKIEMGDLYKLLESQTISDSIRGNNKP